MIAFIFKSRKNKAKMLFSEILKLNSQIRYCEEASFTARINNDVTQRINFDHDKNTAIEKREELLTALKKV